uniref:Uncharacterized protein n=1 Tax=Ditylum brightwellii TaxID=49249 RepID=A0A7S4RKI7_9STRA
MDRTYTSKSTKTPTRAPTLKSNINRTRTSKSTKTPKLKSRQVHLSKSYKSFSSIPSSYPTSRPTSYCSRFKGELACLFVNGCIWSGSFCYE